MIVKKMGVDKANCPKDQKELLDNSSNYMNQKWSADHRALSIWGEVPWMDTVTVPFPTKLETSTVIIEICKISEQIDPEWRRLNAQILAESLNMFNLIRNHYEGNIDFKDFEKEAVKILDKIQTPQMFLEPA